MDGRVCRNYCHKRERRLCWQLISLIPPRGVTGKPLSQQNYTAFAKFALYLDAIPYRPIATLALVPHPKQGRMAGVHAVDDANI
jgi:hypothetical protein